MEQLGRSLVVLGVVLAAIGGVLAFGPRATASPRLARRLVRRLAYLARSTWLQLTTVTGVPARA